MFPIDNEEFVDGNGPLPGFPEIPFELLNDIDIITDEVGTPVVFLIFCSFCDSFGYANEMPLSPRMVCPYCSTWAATQLQRRFRGMIARKRVKKVKTTELFHRWFMTNNVAGNDLARHITQFM
jgi:hypothetical protein